jgi:hemerythrin-like domain-containing protein
VTVEPPDAAAPQPGRVSRRRLLLGVGAGLVVGAGATEAANLGTSDTTPTAVVPPGESLMDEHGVLKRVLLIYGSASARLSSDADVAIPAIHGGAEIIHDFIEGFHEALEEGYVFPALQAAHRLVSTVDTLLLQHARGRLITQLLLNSATPAGLATSSARDRVTSAVAAFTTMYEPHEAREDTVVFPTFRSILTASQIDEYGRTFTDLQQRQFGPNGFADVVGQVATIERSLGTYDLDQYTPRAVDPSF